MIEKILPYVQNNFSKKVSTLFIANVVTHILSLVNLTIISRLFSLEDVGLYSVLLSYVSIAGHYCLLSYNIAIQTSNDRECTYFITGSVFVLLLTSLITYLILLILNVSNPISISVLTMISGINLISDSINIRDGQIYRISIRKIIQPTIQLLYLIGCYLLLKESQPNLSNLITSAILAGSIAMVLFSKKLILNFNLRLGIVAVYSAMKNKIQSSSTLSISDVLNTLAYNLPTILIEKFFGAMYAGFYSIIIRICSVPISLISDSIAKVYLNKLVTDARNNGDNKISYANFTKLRFFMISSSIAGFFVILFTLHPVVTIALGEAWYEAATFGLILSPVFCFGYMITPLSMAFYTLKKEKELLYFQLNYFFISLSAFLIGGFIGNIYISLSIFSIFSCMRYLYIYYKLVNFVKESSF